MINNYFIIEKLNITILVKIINSFLFKKRFKNINIYYLNNTLIDKFFFNFFSLLKIKFSRLDFDYYDIVNIKKIPYHLKLNYEIRDKIILDFFKFHKLNLFKTNEKYIGFYYFLIKYFSMLDFSKFDQRNLIHRKLFLIHVVAFVKKKIDSGDFILFLNSSIFDKFLHDYAKNNDIKLIFFNHFDFINLIFNFLKIVIRHIKSVLNKIFFLNTNFNSNNKIAIETFSNVNIFDPHLASDIFYVNNINISKENILLYHSKNYKIDEVDRKMLHKNKYYLKKFNHFDFKYINFFKLKFFNEHNLNKKQINIIKKLYHDYESKKKSYYNFFKKTQTKIHVTQYRYSEDHIPMTDALNDVNAVSIIWQQAYEEFPSLNRLIYCDIYFAFGNTQDTELLQNSNIKYFVKTGFPYDFRFNKISNKALKVKSELEMAGAKYIISFFDENTHSDKRYFPGHHTTCEDYGYLFKKLINNKDLGMIFKPKKPHTLFQRLNPIKDLLNEAIASKRCFFYMSHKSSLPPVLASIASDISISNCCYSATAALESYLSGTPTLIIDRDYWQESILYKYGSGNIVFNSWDNLWSKIKFTKLQKDIGNWNQFIKILDPYRDGKANERIAEYIFDLYDLLNKGHDKNKALEFAANNFEKKWGHDKIVKLN